jgi:hypothetical protein
MELTDFVAHETQEKFLELKGKKLKFSLLIHKFEAEIIGVELKEGLVILDLSENKFSLQIDISKKPKEKEEGIKPICKLIEKENGKWCMFILGAKVLAS